MRLGLVAAASLALVGTAAAQPRDPYADAPPTGSEQVAPADPVLAEQIAQSLVARAQELLEAKIWLDAKQLAVEAIVRSPKGQSSDHARAIVKQVNQQLGIPDEPEPGEVVGPHDTPSIDTRAIIAPLPPLHDQPEGGRPLVVANVHGAMFGATMGAMVGTFVSSSGGKQAGGAVALGLGGALGGALAAPVVADKLHWSPAQVRTAGAGATWGAVTGAFISDIATGTTGTTGRQILIGMGIGSTVGLLAGGGLATRDKLTTGDVALIDTFAGMGTIGGLTLGMLMQPVESEAYSLNAIVGAGAGIVIGMVAAPQTNTTQRRMLRVAGITALGAAIPFLLYAAIYDPSSDGDERLVGALATGGMVGGCYLGFRLTQGMDEGLDTIDGKPAKPAVDDAPPATITRSSTGHWGLGGVGVQPLSRTLDDHQHGTAFTLLGGRF